MKLLKILFIPLFVLAVDDYDTKWCHSPSEHLKWETLIQDNPHNDSIHAIHALWLGLCIKVDAKQITTNEATQIFENARLSVIKSFPSDVDENQTY